VRRTDQRRAAIWALYQSDLLDRPLQQTLPREPKPFIVALGRVVREHQRELDELIVEHATGWSLERIAPLERSILRVALAEILHADELPGEHAIPAEGAIDEAVETAKQFCGAEAPAFVNGILGAVLRELEPGTSRGSFPGDAPHSVPCRRMPEWRSQSARRS
jgi:N utilization substance protein B